MRIVGSIVLYKNPHDMVKNAIQSFLSGDSQREIILIDHSPKQDLKVLLGDKISYHHNPLNPGYGSGHNQAFQMASNPDYFFVLNPDIVLHKDSVEESIRIMKEKNDVGLVTGKVLNPDGSLQFLLKNDPTIAALIARRMSWFTKWKFFSNAVQEFVWDEKLYNTEREVPIVSGCFMGLRGEVYSKVGGFDDRYFLYFEDFDLCRRIRKSGFKIVYTPKSEIMHIWQREAHKSLKHMIYFGRSLIRYFWNI